MTRDGRLAALRSGGTSIAKRPRVVEFQGQFEGNSWLLGDEAKLVSIDLHW